MKTILYAAAALVAAVAVLIVFTMPSRRVALPGGGADGTIPGILHVHTNRSDGRSTPEEVAAAAARAGLKFVVFTDHGDATRTPDPPAYRSGVLCLDGVEISTSGGHYVALDMPAAPYPLAGEPRDVAEDVRRMGGFGIAAHPDSPKSELRWQDWDVPLDAVELLNPDTSWRVWAQRAASALNGSDDRWAARRRIAFSLLGYPFRAPETIADIMEPIAGERVVSAWTGLIARRRVVSIAGVDAHAMLALHGDPGNGFSLPFPGYAATFEALSVHVRPERPLGGDAAADAAMLVRAIRAGHLYTAVDGLATPASFEFSAVAGGHTAGMGDEIPPGTPLVLHIKSNAPAGFTTTVWNGASVFSGDHHEPEFSVPAVPAPAAYWIEIRASGRPYPIAWLRSNPIYVREADLPVAPAAPALAAARPIVSTVAEPAWRVEHDAISTGAVDVSQLAPGGHVRFRFGLAGAAPTGQYVAFVHDLEPDTFGDRLTFRARANRPMRISVQLRGGDGVVDRWQRSVYLDTTATERTVVFDDCRPVGLTHTPKAPRSTLTSIMLVVDTTNTKPGTAGEILVSEASLQAAK